MPQGRNHRSHCKLLQLGPVQGLHSTCSKLFLSWLEKVVSKLVSFVWCSWGGHQVQHAHHNLQVIYLEICQQEFAQPYWVESDFSRAELYRKTPLLLQTKLAHTLNCVAEHTLRLYHDQTCNLIGLGTMHMSLYLYSSFEGSTTPRLHALSGCT